MPARPATAADLAGLVADARADGRAVTPVGGGTQAHLGYPLARDATPIDCTGLDALVDYPARDLTATVGAGVTIARLGAILAAENQRLAIDIPQAARATVGGSIAANVSGPRRLRSGTLRDALIGVTFVTDRGELASAGGRVVKNVAGYDLMKLHTGALGTLGVLTQVTLKVTPAPEARALVAIPVAGPGLADLLDRLHASPSRPALAELWHRDFAPLVDAGLPAGEWLVVCGFEEKHATVDWQVETLLSELPAAARIDSTQVWDALPELPTLPGLAWRVQLGVPPSRVAESARHLAERGWLVHAHALSGVLTGHRAAEPDLDAARPAAPGSLAVLAAPPGAAAVRWLRSPAEAACDRALKLALDPTNLFNPGRLAPAPTPEG